MTSSIDSESAGMAGVRDAQRSSRWRGVLVFTLLALATAVAFAIGSRALEGRPGWFPFWVAVITIALLAIELIKQTAAIRSGEAMESEAIAEDDPLATSTAAEKTVVVAWFALTIAGILLVGVLPTSFVAGFAYYRWIDRRSTVAGLIAAVALTGGLWVVFELLAGFTLYTGALW